MSQESDQVVAALYRFVTLDNFADLKQPLLAVCLESGVKGTLLLAREGINGTIAGSRAGSRYRDRLVAAGSPPCCARLEGVLPRRGTFSSHEGEDEAGDCHDGRRGR